MRSRRSRQTSNTFYSGESAATHYTWQPMTVCYMDTGTGAEVWRMTSTPNRRSWAIEEYNYPSPWSADGKRMSISIGLSTAAYSLETGNPWFVMTSDGDNLRPMEDASARSNRHRDAINWNPVEPDTFYQVGADYNGEPYDDRYVYRNVVSDGNIAVTRWVDLGTGVDQINKTMAPDGQIALVWDSFRRVGPMHVVRLLPESSKGVEAVWALDSSNRNWDDYWGDVTSPWGDEAHNGHLVGNAAAGYWFYVLPDDSGGSQTRTWVRARPTGSASDGGPRMTTQDRDGSDGWDWGGQIEPANTIITDSDWGEGTCDSGNRDPYCCDDNPATACVTYWSHPAPDRWGTHVAFSNTSCMYGAHCGSPSATEVGGTWTMPYAADDSIRTQHNSWQAFSDYFTFYREPGVGIANYNDSSDVRIINFPEESADYGDDAGSVQSPDGTKLSYESGFLAATDNQDHSDVYFSVAYYPYPPEVTSVMASGGTVTVRVDWRLSGSTPRGYTTRGWPDADSDDPPPPREVQLFRVWRCGDSGGAPDGNWTPLATLNHEIFSRYNFANGDWIGSSSWALTDTPGNGTYHYAVTSQEHSGLESRRLSNAFRITLSDGSGSGSQSVAYPSDPGGRSGFYATAPAKPTAVNFTHCSTGDCSAQSPEPTASGQYMVSWREPDADELVRYYNVYAEDGATPSVAQVNRVASIPAGYCSAGRCLWVDWLGNTGGTTRYVVTSVDFQGNESAAGDAGSDPGDPGGEPPGIVDNLRRTDTQ